MSVPRLLPLLTVLRLWRSGALRQAEIDAMAERVIAVVDAAMRLVMFWNRAKVDRLVEELRTALDEAPPTPPLGGWVARIVIHMGCGTLREEAATLEQIARCVGAGTFAGHDLTPLSYKWQMTRPEVAAEMATVGDLVEAFYERRRGWPSAVEAALLACDALATAEECEGADCSLDRAESAVEELEATIGPEAANWWRRRLRDLHRERGAGT